MRKGQARGIYPAEVDRWYEFFYENYEHVAVLTRWVNELAARHDVSATLRPLVALPIVLEMRDEEVAALEAEAAEKARMQFVVFVGLWFCGSALMLVWRVGAGGG